MGQEQAWTEGIGNGHPPGAGPPTMGAWQPERPQGPHCEQLGSLLMRMKEASLQLPPEVI